MKISIEVPKTDFESLDEAIRENYVPIGDDGTTYRLKDLVDGAWESGDSITGLREALRRERENVKEARHRKSRDIDETKGEAAKLARELEEAREANEAIMKELGQVRTESQVLAAISDTKGMPHALLPVLRDRVKLGDNGIEVLDDDGNLMLGDDGKPMTVKGLLTSMRDDPQWARLFHATGHSGGGTPPNGNGGRATRFAPASQKLRRGQMSTKDKVSFIRENGEDAFMQLPS